MSAILFNQKLSFGSKHGVIPLVSNINLPKEKLNQIAFIANCYEICVHDF